MYGDLRTTRQCLFSSPFFIWVSGTKPMSLIFPQQMTSSLSHLGGHSCWWLYDWMDRQWDVFSTVTKVWYLGIKLFCCSKKQCTKSYESFLYSFLHWQILYFWDTVSPVTIKYSVMRRIWPKDTTTCYFSSFFLAWLGQHSPW